MLTFFPGMDVMLLQLVPQPAKLAPYSGSQCEHRLVHIVPGLHVTLLYISCTHLSAFIRQAFTMAGQPSGYGGSFPPEQ